MTEPRTVALALVHHPVLGRDGAIITTAITNLDIHDMSRSARTYGLSAVFIVHPVPAQQELARRVKSHWTGDGAGARRIPPRSQALELVQVVSTLDDIVIDGVAPERWTTAARGDSVAPFSEARAKLREPGPPVLIVFGTGWGLPPHVLATAALRIAPIVGKGDYNHLSVRAACAITLDRLNQHGSLPRAGAESVGRYFDAGFCAWKGRRPRNVTHVMASGKTRASW